MAQNCTGSAKCEIPYIIIQPIADLNFVTSTCTKHILDNASDILSKVQTSTISTRTYCGIAQVVIVHHEIPLLIQCTTNSSQSFSALFTGHNIYRKIPGPAQSITFSLKMQRQRRLYHSQKFCTIKVEKIAKPNTICLRDCASLNCPLKAQQHNSIY